MSDADPWEIQCVEVEGARNRQGYGVASVQVGPGCYQMRQHRLAWEQAWGLTLKPGQVVRHTCDNPGCVNPMHLQVGTLGDNNRDTVARGRHVSANSRCARIRAHPRGRACRRRSTGRATTWSPGTWRAVSDAAASARGPGNEPGARLSSSRRAVR